MPSPTLEEVLDREARRREALPGGALHQLRPVKAASAPRLAVKAKDSPPPELRTAHRTEMPASTQPIEPKPLSECDDNPVLNEQGAAFIVGVSADLLKKWRQRHKGPDYLQYGKDGPVRYELKALLAFRDDYRIYLSRR